MQYRVSLTMVLISFTLMLSHAQVKTTAKTTTNVHTFIHTHTHTHKFEKKNLVQMCTGLIFLCQHTIFNFCNCVKLIIIVHAAEYMLHLNNVEWHEKHDCVTDWIIIWNCVPLLCTEPTLLFRPLWIGDISELLRFVLVYILWVIPTIHRILRQHISETTQ